LKEENLKDNETSKLLNLMEEASINMTPILKIFSKGVFGKYPW
jgi:hypothetical protein